jgi:hypothetical protein
MCTIALVCGVVVGVAQNVVLLLLCENAQQARAHNKREEHMLLEQQNAALFASQLVIYTI